MSIFVATRPFGSLLATRRLASLAQKHGHALIYASKDDVLDAPAMLEHAKTHEIIIASMEDYTHLWQEKRKPVLRLLAKTGIGTDNINFHEAKRLGIAVTHAPDAPTKAVGELALGLILMHSRGIVAAHQDIQKGKWVRHVRPSLASQSIGILGMGRTGKDLCHRLLGMGAKHILFHDIQNDEAVLTTSLRYEAHQKGAALVSVDFESLIQKSDILSLHLPLYYATHHIIDESVLSKLHGKILINCARGALIDQKALVNHLDSLLLGLDVFETEPLEAHSKLRAHPHVVCTAHMGSCTEESREKMAHAAVDAVEAYLLGDPLPSVAMDEAQRYAPFLKSSKV